MLQIYFVLCHVESRKGVPASLVSHIHLTRSTKSASFILSNYVFQEAMLKAELRNMERSEKREGIDMTYLKNVILKLLETGTRLY
jgi:hypothetical protein